MRRCAIPVRATEDGLLTPGTRVAGGLGAHPAGLAPLTAEQAVQEGVGGGGDTRGGKQRADALLGLPQRRRPELQRGLERVQTKTITTIASISRQGPATSSA